MSNATHKPDTFAAAGRLMNVIRTLRPIHEATGEAAILRAIADTAKALRDLEPNNEDGIEALRYAIANGLVV